MISRCAVTLIWHNFTHGSGWVEQNVFFFFNPYLQKLQSDFKNVNFEWCGITRAQNQSVGPKTLDCIMRTLWPKNWKILIFHLRFFSKRILNSTTWKGSSMRTFSVLFIFLCETYWASYDPFSQKLLYILQITHIMISQKVLIGLLSYSVYKLSIMQATTFITNRWM